VLLTWQTDMDYVGLLPAWGDKTATGSAIFNAVCKIIGGFLATGIRTKKQHYLDFRSVDCRQVEFQECLACNGSRRYREGLVA